jgi:HicB family
MELAPHVEALVRDLTAIAAVGDDATSQAAARLAAALKASAGMRLLDALSEAALELSDQLPDGHVEVRLAGQQPSLVYVEDEPPPASAPSEDALSVRITLRLPESLKTAVESAAARDGVSVNTWLVRALARAVSSWASRGSGPGNRLRGYARS